MYRVVQWATGSMGRTALRRIVDHPDLELAGLYVYDPQKAGRDAGEIARRPATGVIATDRIDDILALDADVVIHTSRISFPYEKQNDDVARLLSSGKNVISTAGFHYPQAHGSAYAGPLMAACRQGNATLAGLGLNPGFIAERLAVMLTGMCAELHSITTYETADASNMASPAFVFDTMRFGVDPAVEDVTRGPFAGLFGTLFAEVFAYVAAALGTSVARIEPRHDVVVAPHDIRIKAGIVPRGRVAATVWRWQATFADGRTMVHSVTWTAEPALHGSVDAAAHWRVEVKGRPNISLAFGVLDPDPAMPATRAAADATIAIAVNAIPDVVAAPAGFFAYPPLVPFRARF
jgi:hypothetical protein